MLKRGFTLIEIMIVLGIVSVLFAISLNLSRGRIGQIQTRMEKEGFVDAMTQTTTRLLTTKRYNGQPMQAGSIILSS